MICWQAKLTIDNTAYNRQFCVSRGRRKNPFPSNVFHPIAIKYKPHQESKISSNRLIPCNVSHLIKIELNTSPTKDLKFPVTVSLHSHERSQRTLRLLPKHSLIEKRTFSFAIFNICLKSTP